MISTIYRFIYKQYLFIRIQNNNYDTRFDAAYTLKEKFGITAVEGLIYILRHKNKDVRHDIAYTLEQITGKYNGDNYDTWKTWWDKNKKRIIKKYYS